MSGGCCSSCGNEIPAGPAGVDGLNVFTKTTADFTQPAVNSNVTITVSAVSQYSIEWAKPNDYIWIQGGGYYQVVTYIDSTSIEVKNLGSTDNAAPLATVTSGAYVHPSGPPGAGGTNGTDGTNGVAVIDYDFADNSHTGDTSWTSLYSKQVDANTLDANEEYIEGEFFVSMGMVGGSAKKGGIKIKFGTTTLFTHDTTTLYVPFGENFLNAFTSLKVKFRMIRTDTDKARLEVDVTGLQGQLPSSGSYLAVSGISSGYNELRQCTAEVSSLNFAANTNMVVEGKVSDSSATITSTAHRLIKGQI